MSNNKIPRLPLEGSIDLTYRCNNTCRHCWLWLGEDSTAKKSELRFDQWKMIFDQARAMGTREWVVSGGEPMLHPDFTEIFDYLTSKFLTYTINTNGTKITPEIAELMKRKGSKMIALYGADAAVHDHITREPGSFEKAMKGFSFLKEAGAGFTVQVVPMKDSFHQLDEMTKLAKSLSSSWRIGSSWLFYSACRSASMNREIEDQRLTPEQVVALDPPNPRYNSKHKLLESDQNNLKTNPDDRLLHKCVSTRNSFHIDPYGKMANCIFVKDPELRYDIIKGTFEEGWEKFIPSIGEKIRGGEEYWEHCGSCDNKELCNWCPVYSWLEHGKYDLPLKYLCEITDKKVEYKKEWEKNHRRYYEIGGVTIQVDSDLPFEKDSFLPKFEQFRMEEPGDDIVLIRYHFEIPELSIEDSGEEIYRKIPWAIYRKNKSWLYREILENRENDPPRRIVIFNDDHTLAEIYLKSHDLIFGSPQHALSLFPSDQLLLSRIFADREALTLHSSAMVIDQTGLVFSGKSTAGKSTISTLLEEEGTLLCDEYNIIRKWPDGFRVHGTWSHGDIHEVSNGEVPLKAILFLEKSNVNEIITLEDTQEIITRIMPRIMQPLVTSDWWDKTLATLDRLVNAVPFYIIKFDKSGEIARVVKDFTKVIKLKKK